MKPTIRRKKKSIKDKSKHFKENALKGSGLYLFKNHKKADLFLPKPTESGINMIPSGGTWEGDDYYFLLVRSNLAQLVKQIKSSEEVLKNEGKIMEEKLLLEQDPFVTEEGTVEHVVATEQQLQESKTKSKTNKTKKDKKVLITDKLADSGIEIL